MPDNFLHISDRSASRCLCFVGGFVDAFGFINLKGVFTASVTGNIVKVAHAAVSNKLAKSLLIMTLSYGMGSALVRLISIWLKSRQLAIPLIGMSVLIVELVLLAVSTVVGTYFSTSITNTSNIDDISVLVTGVVMSISMGAQFAVAAAAFPTFPNTCGMTASVATTFSALANLCLFYLSKSDIITFYLSAEENSALAAKSTENISGRELFYKEMEERVYDELDRQLSPLIYFTGGAMCGSVMAEPFGYKSLLLPMGIVLTLVVELAAKNLQSSCSEKLKGPNANVISIECFEDSEYCSVNVQIGESTFQQQQEKYDEAYLDFEI